MSDCDGVHVSIGVACRIGIDKRKLSEAERTGKFYLVWTEGKKREQRVKRNFKALNSVWRSRTANRPRLRESRRCCSTLRVSALPEYELDLKFNPNRFNGLYGAALAAEEAGQADKARKYCLQPA